MAGKVVIRELLRAVLFFCVLAGMLPGPVQATELPAIEQLAGITMDKALLWSPSRLSVGNDGTLYVVDSYKNHIAKFDRSGAYTGDISSPRVSAVAVAPNGTLFVGSHLDYAVSIIKNGQVVGHFGAGNNEFRSIRDIAYDAGTGLVYVADNAGNSVRVFDEAGREQGAINNVNLPIAIEVTPDAIYIIDSPVVSDSVSVTTASRISIFDKNYNLLRVIEEKTGERLMYRPTDIAVSGSIIYISDAALRSVLLFDTQGSFLGEMEGGGEINTALGMAITSDGLLYVSSSDTHSLEIFSITGTGTKAGSSGN